MRQTPLPGQHKLACCGDTLEFRLQLPAGEKGRAWLRTNIGHAATAREAIIREVRDQQPRLAEDWFDIPMQPLGQGEFRLVLPLVEPGHFEAKAFFVPANGGETRWPSGLNTVINVHPAAYAAGNSLYNAFVRQFGDAEQARANAQTQQSPPITQLDAQGWTVIPPSGTFRDFIKKLDFIVERLHCRIIMLLPIHPVPTVYARMGRFGSPYAALDFMEVDPALAEFDKKATPLEQFQEMVDAIHARQARLFLDIAINHVGWAAKIHSLHPDWLARDSDGTIRSPGAWGVIWRDLTELNYVQLELWQYLAEVFLTWCRRGVDGFRCDAGYMIPVPAWEYIIATVRRQFPDTVFLLEGLGGSMEATNTLLNKANMNWAYSELFQNHDRRQMEHYLPDAIRAGEGLGVLMHFAETHDNLRLAARSQPYARMRTALAALCSTRGAFGFTNGVEWFATEKIDVHKRSFLNWDSAQNQVDAIARLNALLSTHPVFWGDAQLRLIQQGAGNSIALSRRNPVHKSTVLVLANLDDTQPQPVNWNPDEAELPASGLIDLLSGRELTAQTNGALATVQLAPAEVLCLSAQPDDLRLLLAAEQRPLVATEQAQHQSFRAAALKAWVAIHGTDDVAELDVGQMANKLARDPRAFCRELMPAGGAVLWHWPRDNRREVMLPPDRFLLIQAAHAFRARMDDGTSVLAQEDALPQSDGSWFVLLPPFNVPAQPQKCELRMTVHAPQQTRHTVGHVLLLPRGDQIRVPAVWTRDQFLDQNMLTLATNGRGGMLHAGVAWSEIRSRYNALLAANLSAEYPEDRRVMLTRCRAWLVYHGYSQPVSIDRQQLFVLLRDGGLWRFRIPFGHGRLVGLDVRAEMIAGKNAVRLLFYRHPVSFLPRHNSVEDLSAESGRLPDAAPVTLIIRPDIEDRDFHHDTKAWLGAEKAFPAAVRALENGFKFAPSSGHWLNMEASAGSFHVEPEWYYNIHHPLEQERGMEPYSDLFSPGYFKLALKGGQEVAVMAQVCTALDNQPLSVGTRRKTVVPAPRPQPLLAALEAAMRQFIARRDSLKTVIAGYPWFLDWGRDTLICARGLLAAGYKKEVSAILRQFAKFEKNGTLPNIIQGKKAGNFDTSDAPLWLITACADWCHVAGNYDLLDQSCGSRTVRQALRSILEGYLRGTPNGIRVDEESGLVFSPAHFTWMDTNFPAATPREGYPIEIQALWHAALVFMSRVDGNSAWANLAGQVRASILRLYWDPTRGYLSDCLHAPAGPTAAHAVPDDALRPNQLLAITLGALDDLKIGQSILDACQELLVPGAIRSLADRPVEIAQPVYRDGHLLNDPMRPYWGHYRGDEDTRRKPAYHNGTAWTWQFPSFSEAWLKIYGEAGKSDALAWLASSSHLINNGCLGQVPEILDGDYPHQQRGCDAQAWGATELYRVLKMLHEL